MTEVGLIEPLEVSRAVKSWRDCFETEGAIMFIAPDLLHVSFSVYVMGLLTHTHDVRTKIIISDVLQVNCP